MRLLIALSAALLIASCTSSPDTTSMTPPVADMRPIELEMHGDVRVDEYFWLREREDPEVIAYLEAENAYTEAMTAATRDLENELFEEIKARIKEDDSSVPYRKGEYFYYTRYEEGKDYAIYCRKRGSLDADEEIMLDANELAEGHDFFSVRTSVSPDATVLAFATDTVGRRKYTLRFKNLASEEVFGDAIEDVTGNVAWANDNETIFYTRQDPETLRWFRVHRHTLGESTDALVFEEADDEFSVYVTRSQSDRFVLIGSTQTMSAEFRYIDADNPTGPIRVLAPRERGHEYSVDHLGDRFFIRTNYGGATNFKLMSAPETPTPPAEWTEVLPHRDDVFLVGFSLFNDYLVASERSAGLVNFRIQSWEDGESHYVSFPESAYSAYLAANPEPNTTKLRFGYSSMTTPWSTYDYDMEDRTRELLKRDPVLGDFDPANYTTERVFAAAGDGTPIPISLVYRNDLREEGQNPLLLYAYGSYGSTVDASFSSPVLSLLDRGFVYAIAHVRGGQINGRSWYEDGKLLNKKNTFTDFINAADYLASAGYADPDRMYARGGSAGGLLMGAVLNMAPERFHGVIADVPWVDVVTTMLDDSIPLTTSEYDEWGNPNDPEYYEYMLSYSPYDNVEAKDYPNILVTTGLHDSQVQYWEPAKWVARLRAKKTDSNMLLLKTDMDSGHGGASGRYERYKETAFRYAFLVGLAESSRSEDAPEALPSTGG